MVGGLDKSDLSALQLAQQLGYFEEQGVRVSAHREPAGVARHHSLLSGKVEGVVGFYDHTIDLQGLGQVS